MFLDLKLRSKDTITFTVFYMASTGPVKTRPWMTRLRRADGGRAVQRAVGCVCASSLGRREGSGAASSVAANGCVSASSLGRAGRQRGQRVYPRRSLVRLG